MVKRMIKEFGDAMSLVCSQTLNACDELGCLTKPALFRILGDKWSYSGKQKD